MKIEVIQELRMRLKRWEKKIYRGANKNLVKDEIMNLSVNELLNGKVTLNGKWENRTVCSLTWS